MKDRLFPLEGHNQALERKGKEKTRKRSVESYYTPLSQPLEDVFYEIYNAGVLPTPKPKKADLNRRDTMKFCEYHGDYSHNTNDYFKLQKAIQEAIKNSYLKYCVADSVNRV